jgi:glycosyltransferase involved in cell wall biosynthesis
MEENPGSKTQTPERIGESRVRVLVVAAHDSLGGAARAIYRVYSALRGYESTRIEVTLRVPNKTQNDPGVLGGKPQRNSWEYARYWLRTRWRAKFPGIPFQTENRILHSQALYDTGLGREINEFGADVVMFGWLGGSTLSIDEIGRIKAPIVWRMSDLWLVSGAEHYTDAARYAKGYSRSSRPHSESGPDVNRKAFRRKLRRWKTPQHVVALSRWMLEQAEMSVLTKAWSKSIIPVPLDPEEWAPRPALEAREQLGLPKGKMLVCFGAGQASKHFHKGADLLFEALNKLWGGSSDKGKPEFELVVFGEEENPRTNVGFKVHYLGKLGNSELATAYSAIDVLVVPSRLEAFGQVAAEAQMCGAPVVVFDNSGLTDVVSDRITGRVVPAFDTQALADAIAWVLADRERRDSLRRAARERAIGLWHPRVVARQYADLLISVAKSKANKPRHAIGRSW